MEKQWQYRGFPPVSRIIEGTLNSDRPIWNRIYTGREPVGEEED